MPYIIIEILKLLTHVITFKTRWTVNTLILGFAGFVIIADVTLCVYTLEIIVLWFFLRLKIYKCTIFLIHYLLKRSQFNSNIE